MLNIQDIHKIAHLGRISITDEEAEKQLKELTMIMEMMDLLKEIDTTGIEPLNHVLDLSNVLRTDDVEASMLVDEVLKNAPDEHDNMFRVPKIV